MSVEELLNLLPLLACPVGMGLMPWMMRGGQDRTAGSRDVRPGVATVDHPTAEASQDNLARLRAELATVRARQAAVAEQIDRLRAEGRPAASHPTARVGEGEPSEVAR